jgi:tetratricopeptide (TPR) repeat protein
VLLHPTVSTNNAYTIGMIRAFVRPAGAILLLLAAAPDVWADTVRLAGKPAFRNVRISDFRAGRVIFRGVSGQYLHKPLEQVVWLEIDELPQLGIAEHAGAAGHWDRAAAAYRLALARADRPWLRDLIRFRLLSTYDRAGRFDEAVGLYAELLEGKAAAVLAPRRPGSPGSAVNARARRRLVESLATSDSTAARRHLRTLLLELLLYDGEEVPLELGLAIAPATQPAPARSPILGLPMGRKRHSTRPTVRLSTDSLLLSAARSALDEGDAERAVELLERGWPYVKRSARGSWRLLLGQARIEAGRYAQAAADLLDLAETAAEPDLAATALYYVGLAHERMEQTDVAGGIYRELLERGDVPERVRADAAAALERLGD